MVARVKNDMDQIERQLSEAESTVEPTTASGTALKSIVPYIFVSLFSISYNIQFGVSMILCFNSM